MKPVDQQRDSLLATAEPNPRVAASVSETNGVLEELVRGAQREGGMGTDITPPEVITILNLAVCRPAARRDDPIITVVLDGLRSSAQAGTSR
ncbi:hypothetical protein [Nocardia sp. NPDC050175]|uniref:SbtR family transcriptional regulator n=1 Tax=Nocardia sp. NPDC050175 TaxID=3364317 RepID=UPI0037987427